MKETVRAEGVAHLVGVQEFGELSDSKRSKIRCALNWANHPEDAVDGEKRLFITCKHVRQMQMMTSSHSLLCFILGRTGLYQFVQ